jgi:hypothetical protein
MSGSRQLLRHVVATLAYRGAKAVRGAPDDFAGFSPAPTSRTPSQILAHIGDLLDWTVCLCRGQQVWHDSPPLPWPEEVARFHRALAAVDAVLASDDPLGTPVERLFQGPLADALTHVGQLTMLRRMFGAPVKGENYAKAEIVAGGTGPDQATPRREFD